MLKVRTEGSRIGPGAIYRTTGRLNASSGGVGAVACVQTAGKVHYDYVVRTRQAA